MGICGKAEFLIGDWTKPTNQQSDIIILRYTEVWWNIINSVTKTNIY